MSTGNHEVILLYILSDTCSQSSSHSRLEMIIQQCDYRIEETLILACLDQFSFACYISTPIEYKPVFGKRHKRAVTHRNIRK